MRNHAGGSEESTDRAEGGCWRSALGWWRSGLRGVVRSGSVSLPSQDDGVVPRGSCSVATDRCLSKTLSRDCDGALVTRAQAQNHNLRIVDG